MVENAPKTNDVKTDLKDENGPVNKRTIENNVKTSEAERVEGPEVSMDAHSIAVLNLSQMGPDTKEKMEIMLKGLGRNMDTFGSEKGDTSFFPYAPKKLGLNIRMTAGNYKAGEKDGKAEYLPHLALPANITLSDPNDWQKNIQLDILQLIKAHKYIGNVLEANRPAVSYYVALQKEINQRENDEDVGF